MKTLSELGDYQRELFTIASELAAVERGLSAQKVSLVRAVAYRKYAAYIEWMRPIKNSLARIRDRWLSCRRYPLTSFEKDLDSRITACIERVFDGLGHASMPRYVTPEGTKSEPPPDGTFKETTFAELAMLTRTLPNLCGRGNQSPSPTKKTCGCLGSDGTERTSSPWSRVNQPRRRRY